MGGGNTYIPLKVNTAGVIPVIFATSVLIFPALLTTMIPSNAGWLEAVRDWVNTNFGFGTGSTWTYIIGLFLLSPHLRHLVGRIRLRGGADGQSDHYIHGQWRPQPYRGVYHFRGRCP